MLRSDQEKTRWPYLGEPGGRVVVLLPCLLECGAHAAGGLESVLLLHEAVGGDDGRQSTRGSAEQHKVRHEAGPLQREVSSSAKHSNYNGE